MFNTATDLYQYFLDGIKKEYTGTVVTNVFARLWNVAQAEWLASNVSQREGVDVTQKQMDDLAVLLRVHEIAPASTNVFALPDGLLTDVNGDPMDKYFRMTSLRVKINYGIGNDCGLTGESGWLKPYIMRSDLKAYAYESPYREPKEDMVYYKRIGNNYNVILGDSSTSTASSLQLEYFTYPLELSATGNVFSAFTGFQEHQLLEIINLCIRKYLERVRDQRYGTTMNEQAINNINKI